MKMSKRLSVMLALLFAVCMAVSYTHLEVYKRQGRDAHAAGDDAAERRILRPHRSDRKMCIRDRSRGSKQYRPAGAGRGL